MRFTSLSLLDPVPDAKTIWFYREQLARAGADATIYKFEKMGKGR